MTNKHTELPWKVDDRFKTSVRSCNKQGQGICSTGGYSDNRRDPEDLAEELEANARLIVTAVNFHQRLREALDGLMSCFSEEQACQLSTMGRKVRKAHAILTELDNLEHKQ